MAQPLDQDLPQSPTEPDNVHYTVFIRLPFPRGDFVDPPSVSLQVFYCDMVEQIALMQNR